jgi:hypothetical protein
MHGLTIFSYTLVAFAITSYAIPLKVRTDHLLERPPDLDLTELVGKVGSVKIGEGYVERLQDVVDACVQDTSYRSND